MRRLHRLQSKTAQPLPRNRNKASTDSSPSSHRWEHGVARLRDAGLPVVARRGCRSRPAIAPGCPVSIGLSSISPGRTSKGRAKPVRLEPHDRIVDQVGKYGFKLLVRVSQDPDKPFWAGNPPENSQHFTDFLAALAKRYKGRIGATRSGTSPIWRANGATSSLIRRDTRRCCAVPTMPSRQTILARQ